ncbi:MAG: 4Fe-4S binding protein [Candidatus Bathyarchaeia archaeon]
MGSRKTVKTKTRKEIFLERATLSTRQVLTLIFELCVGCGICEKICPEKAVTISPAIIHNGRLIKKGQIDIDADKCMFCGECVVLCLLNAIKIEIDGKERVPVVENEVFPVLVKDITVNVSICDPVCKLACQEICPTKAIKVMLEGAKPLEMQKIVGVQIDKKLCVFCKKCEDACPVNAIRVTKPISGLIELAANKCPEGCRVCVDVCPSKCIDIDESGKPTVSKEYCIYCGVCQEVCPEKAITVGRTAVSHTEIKSGAWNEALEKLISYKALVKELNVKSKKKMYARASAVKK